MNSTLPRSDKKIILSAKNVLKILNCFTLEEPQQSITSLAKKLGLAKSTVSRLMSTLASEGFVHQDARSKHYRLGFSILYLSGVVTADHHLYNEAVPVLEKLVKTAGETAHVSLLNDTKVTYLLKEECTQQVRIISSVGGSNPSHCTSSGKVMLAFQKEDVVRKVIERGLKQYTPNTITDPEQLYAELRMIRKQGYAVQIEEFVEGIVGVGAPIRDYTGTVIAAVTLVAPVQRMNETNMQQFVKQAIAAGHEISSRLGYFKH